MKLGVKVVDKNSGLEQYPNNDDLIISPLNPVVMATEGSARQFGSSSMSPQGQRKHLVLREPEIPLNVSNDYT